MAGSVRVFLESLDTTILNTAVPAISAALHVTPLSMKAVRASAIQNFVVGSINLAEPNAALFEPPSGYRIVSMEGQ